VINLDQFLNKSWYQIYGASPVWSILPKPGFEEQVFQTLSKASKTMNFTVYKKDQIPEEYHYRNNRRILPIFIVADEGWDIYQNMTWTPKGLKVLHLFLELIFNLIHKIFNYRLIFFSPKEKLFGEIMDTITRCHQCVRFS
jgi:hypothetical protein